MPNVPLKPLDSFLLAAVRYGLLAVFALPFVVVLQYLYPWVSGKIWGFQVMVEVLFPLYVLLAFRRREFRPDRSPLLWALLAYFAVATLAMLLGDNPHRSFWSKPDRLTGMFFQYHLLAFFLMASSVWRSVMRMPIISAVTSAVILSLHAISQAVNPAPGTDGRGSATLGNPSYLGQYLVPHLFLAGWLLLRDWKSLLRWLWIGAGGLIALGIFSTKSKGALLGVGLGLVAAAAIAAVRGGKASRRFSLIGIGLLLVLTAAFLLGNRVSPFKDWLYANRLSIQYFQETSGSRKLLIANVLKGIAQRPLLGWGPENFEGGYYFNYDPTTLRYSEYETRQDRPHNLPLEILHNLGVIGLLAYAAVFACAVRLAVSRRRADWVWGAGLVVAALAQLGTDLFIFETPMSYLALFTLLALVAADAGGRTEPRAEGPDEAAPAAVPLAVLAAAVSLWCFRYPVVDSMRAAKLTSRMIVALSQEGTPEAWKAMLTDLRALKTPYYERDIRALTSHLSRTRGEYLQGPYREILIGLADDEYRRLGSNRNDYVHALVTASAYLSVWPRTAEQQAALEDAASAAAARSPNRHEVEAMLAQLAWEKGDLASAEAHVRRMRELDPANPYGDGWWVRWNIQFGDPAEAVKRLKENPRVKGDPQAWSMVEYGTLHAMTARRWKELLALQEASAAAELRNVQWDLTGAIAAWALGEKEKSDAIIAQSLELYPDRADLVRQIAGSRERIVTVGG